MKLKYFKYFQYILADYKKKALLNYYHQIMEQEMENFYRSPDCRLLIQEISIYTFEDYLKDIYKE